MPSNLAPVPSQQEFPSFFKAVDAQMRATNPQLPAMLVPVVQPHKALEPPLAPTKNPVLANPTITRHAQPLKRPEANALPLGLAQLRSKAFGAQTQATQAMYSLLQAEADDANQPAHESNPPASTGTTIRLASAIVGLAAAVACTSQPGADLDSVWLFELKLQAMDAQTQSTRAMCSLLQAISEATKLPQHTRRRPQASIDIPVRLATATAGLAVAVIHASQPGVERDPMWLAQLKLQAMDAQTQALQAMVSLLQTTAKAANESGAASGLP